uniref:Uncharacterized protein n=1 Tax=Rhizophora mucronata TaxID=61149 RepID=A0A2P2PLD3_RHIMU
MIGRIENFVLEFSDHHSLWQKEKSQSCQEIECSLRAPSSYLYWQIQPKGCE